MKTIILLITLLTLGQAQATNCCMLEKSGTPVFSVSPIMNCETLQDLLTHLNDTQVFMEKNQVAGGIAFDVWCNLAISKMEELSK